MHSVHMSYKGLETSTYLLLAFLEGGAILSTLCASLPTKEIEEEYYIS